MTGVTTVSHGSIPVTIADALDQGKVRAGDVLAIGTFSNAGDVVSGAVLRWR